MMWFPISPKTREKEREDQRFEFTPRTKRSAKERKKNESTACKTYQRKRKTAEEKEREKETMFFLRKERHFSSLFSLSFL